MTVPGGRPVAARLSVVCVVGTQRARARRLIAALAAQRDAPELELILLDGGPDDDPIDPLGMCMIRLVCPVDAELGRVRAAGWRAARGEIVAFLFDHCRPEEDWARALVARYRDGPWAAVGYGFAVAVPDSRAARAAVLAQFGPWLYRDAQAVDALPGYNVSYRRDAIDPTGTDVAGLLEADFNLQVQLASRGLAFALEPAAGVRYENFGSVAQTCRSNLRYGWLQSSRRAQLNGWGWRRRALFAAGSLTVGQLRRVREGIRTLRRAPGPLRSDLACLPAMVAIGAGWAVGQSCGYLLGERSAAQHMIRLERDVPRALDS